MDKLIDPVLELEKCKRMIGPLKQMYDSGTYEYIGGTLFIGDIENPITGVNHIECDVRPLSECGVSEIARESQYLISKMYVKYKGETKCFYQQALTNIKEYED